MTHKNRDQMLPTCQSSVMIQIKIYYAYYDAPHDSIGELIKSYLPIGEYAKRPRLLYDHCLTRYLRTITPSTR
ncbi:MAG TPA: hypothetical protein O0X73_04120 [Methanocorpusculum sp.]|nr:hypothetical protein [Methanocorpusculum sp.]